MMKSSPDQFLIANTTNQDLQTIFDLFDESIRYQEAKGYNVWKDYDKNVIFRDIEEGNQYKVVIGEDVAIVFSVCYRDAVIWRGREQGNAMYLHRIVVNPKSKGMRLFGVIFNWAIEHARAKQLSYIRMDTWADNQNIIDYYKSFGFTFIENFTTPATDELPVHNRNLNLALLEYAV